MAGSAWFKVTSVGLNITRKTKPPFEQWESEVVISELRRKSEPWWRGDLYLRGEEWYGEDKATSIFDPLTMDVKTWQNNASICRRIDLSRRREELTYSHHAEVAYLEPEQFAKESPHLAKLTSEGLQDHYLALAIENGLSIRKLRDAINADKGHEGVSFEVGALNERADALAKKVGSLISNVKKDLPTMGHDAVEHLLHAHDELNAASDELTIVMKKHGKLAA